MANVTTAARPMPRAIRRGLGRVDRRLRAIGALKGLGIAAIVLAVGAIVGMSVDLAWVLPREARWLIWGTWLAAVGAAMVAGVLGPIARRVRWTDLAAVAETGHPELGERLTSAVDLLESENEPHGSPELIAALADDAGSRANGLDLGKAVTSKRALGWLGAGGLAIGLVGAPAVVWPDPCATLWRRLLAPWEDAPRVGRFVIDEIRPGNAVAALGSTVEIAARVRPRLEVDRANPPESAWLEWNDGNEDHRARMLTDGEITNQARIFKTQLPRLAGSIRYRVTTDATSSHRYRLDAVEPPAVRAFVARVVPPSYTKFPTRDAPDPSRMIEAWEGSAITLTITTNKSVRPFEVQWLPAVERGSKATSALPKPWSRPRSAAGNRWEAAAVAEETAAYTFELVDAHDLSYQPDPPGLVRVIHDRPPTVILLGADGPEEAGPEDVLAVDLAARDDVAVDRAELHYAIERAKSGGSESGRIEMELEGRGQRRARGRSELSLAPLNLKEGDLIAYYVEVADNRPAPRGPNVARSGERLLKIVAKAEPLEARRAANERSGLREQLEAIRRDAAANRRDAVQLRYAADAARRGNGTWDDAKKEGLRRVVGDAREVIDKLNHLAHDFEESGRFGILARPTRQIAEVEAEGSRVLLDQARRADDDHRIDDLQQADARLAVLQGRLDELQRRFDELSRIEDDRRKLRELAGKQEDLARKVADAAKQGDRAALEQLRAEQERLRNEVDQLAQRSPELRAEALAAHERVALRMAEKLRDLARRQRDEARRTAEAPERPEALRALAAAQRKIEDDARRLALDVDQALSENGRGRVDVNATARAVEPLERGDVEQGQPRLAEAEDALRRLARDLDDVRDDPKALARRLARREEILRNQAVEAINAAKTPEEKATRLKRFAEHQAAIAELAKAIPAPEAQQAHARDAAGRTETALDDIRNGRSELAPGHMNEARDALNRLADVLPDPNQVRQQARQRLNEARQRTDQVARELDQHLRETAPRPGQPDDPAGAARELARRIAPLVDRQREAVAILATLDVDRPAQVQRDRAARRAQRLADTLDELRDLAPPEPSAKDAQAVRDWHLLGTFERRANPPFTINRPIDLKAAHKGKRGPFVTWRPFRAVVDGVVDLGALYSREDNQAAFGVAEIESPARGKGRLVVGSDDDLTIWINGKHVYNFPGERSFNPGQDRVEVDLSEGTNHLLIRCGNGNADWKFVIGLAAPLAGELALRAARSRALREGSPAVAVDARAALERLDQKLEGRVPADDLAAELSEDLKNFKLDISNLKSGGGERAEEARRIATALRGLDAPDATRAQAEAVRRAGRLIEALARPDGESESVAQDAAEVAGALARRLADMDEPRARVAELARAQRGLIGPDAPRDPSALARVQGEIEADLARVPIEGKDDASAAVARAAELTGQAAHPPRPDAVPMPAEIATAQARAAEALDALARRPEPAADLPAAANPRARAVALAQRQRDLALRIEEAGAATGRDEAAQARLADSLRPLAGRQEALAGAARTLFDPIPPGDPARHAAEPLRREARTFQDRAAVALARRDPTEAARAAREAAGALDRLAHALPEHPPGPSPAHPSSPADPELALRDEHAGAARALARRQREVRQRLQALLGDRIEPQDHLRTEATDLGRDLAELREASRPVSGRGQGPAHAATDLMEHQAPEAMRQGIEQLAQGHPQTARDAQRRAAELVEHAAQQAEDLAAAFRADRPGDAPPASGRLAEARAAQQRAHGQLARAAGMPDPDANSEPVQAARAAMHEAASGLRAASMPSSNGRSDMAGEPGAMPRSGQPGGESADPGGGPGGRVDLQTGELAGMIPARGGRKWGELPGHLRTEILQMAQGRYRDDYARLIQLYFREIAAGEPETPREIKP